MQWWRLGVPLVALSCGNRFATSPFVAEDPESPDAGRDEQPPINDAGLIDSPDVLPNEVLGGPCVDDAQCDDAIECTFGVCDTTLSLCRFVADDSRCADALFCNGVERCDPRIGCRPGPPTSCSDVTPCTIDHCDEATKSCVRTDRDVDGDGDVDGNCQPGGDCNDLDPRIASTAPELCGNQRDDDCDGEVDESDCQVPEFDTCASGLAIGGPGSYLVSPAGAVLDYGVGCATEGPALRELVLFVDVPPGDARDVDIVARTPSGNLTLARPSACGVTPGTNECARGVSLPTGEFAVRLHLYSPAPGLQPIYLYTDSNAPIQLDVATEAASIDAVNLSCDAPAALEPGTPVDVDLSHVGTPAESDCPVDRGDRYFEFSIATLSDVSLAAESLDGLGEPRLSIRGAGCDTPELRCSQRPLAAMRVRALPAGNYTAALSASGPTRARLSLSVRPPTAAPAADGCDSAPGLTPNRTEVLNFDELDDDIEVGCSPGAVDTARRLDLTVASDVLLVARFSSGDVGAVTLSQPACREADAIDCLRTAAELARVSRRGLPAGEYRVVVESLLGLPATVMAAVRPTSAPTLVPGSEACGDSVAMDPEGGFYQGNTSNALPDLSASCDFATPAGAPDQLLGLSLPAPRRVVLDMRGSDFDTLLNVRRGPTCPGEEVIRGCTAFTGGDRSFLDLDLQAGEYFVQIDGYAGASGNWFLNVFTAEP